MNILQLEQVTKSYNKHLAVDQVSFNVPKGSILAYLARMVQVRPPSFALLPRSPEPIQGRYI